MTRKERLDAAALLAAVGIACFIGVALVWWVGLCVFLTFLIVDHWVNVSAGTYE